MKVYYEKDADLNTLKDKVVAIIGYGSQGHAHAQNLRDSGVRVVVGQRPGRANWQLAREHGFEPVTAAEAAKKADLIQILVQDQYQPKVYEEEILPNLSAGKTLVFGCPRRNWNAGQGRSCRRSERSGRPCRCGRS